MRSPPTALLSCIGQLRGKTCQPFNSDTKVRIVFPDHTRFYYPDAMVVCHPNPASDHFQDLPVVVIEVLSDSTRRADLGEKRDAYLTIPSLQVLLFVESDAAAVTVHRRQARWRLCHGIPLRSREHDPIAGNHASLPLAELYERVVFAS